MAETIVQQNNLERCRLTSKDIRMMASISGILREEALEFGRSIVATRVTDIIFSKAVREIIGGEIKDINVTYLKKRIEKDEFLSNMMRNTTSIILAVSLLDTSKYGVSAKYSYQRGCEIYGVETMSQDEIRTLVSDASPIVDFNIDVMLKNIKSKLMSIVNVNKEKLELIKSIDSLKLGKEHTDEEVKEFFDKYTEIACTLESTNKVGVVKKLEKIFNSTKLTSEFKINWVRNMKVSYLISKRKLLYLEVLENERKWFGIKVKDSQYFNEFLDVTRTKKESFEDNKLADKYLAEMVKERRSRYSKISHKIFSEILILENRITEDKQ